MSSGCGKHTKGRLTQKSCTTESYQLMADSSNGVHLQMAQPLWPAAGIGQKQFDRLTMVFSKQTAAITQRIAQRAQQSIACQTFDRRPVPASWEAVACFPKTPWFGILVLWPGSTQPKTATFATGNSGHAYNRPRGRSCRSAWPRTDSFTLAQGTRSRRLRSQTAGRRCCSEVCPVST